MPEGRPALLSRLRHAFAVDPEGPAATSAGERELVDRVCGEILRRRLTTPALMLLEMSRPLNFVGSQLMRFFQPMVGAVMPTGGYERFATLLEKRGSIETLRRRLEQLEAEAGPGAKRAAEPGEEPSGP